jgi:hypothetical protein
MQAITDAVNSCLRDFATYVAQRHNLDEKVVLTDLTTWLTGDPKVVASKITSITEDSESSSEGEIKTSITNGVDIESESDASEQTKAPVESEDDEPDLPPKVKQSKVKSKKAPVDESDDDEPPVVKPKSKKAPPPVEMEPESLDDDEPPPKSAKRPAKAKPVEIEPESLDEEDEESEPVPKTKASKSKVSENVIELSDTPKLPVKDRPKLPKNVKFQKGTNNVVHNGKVVAIVSKKGLVKLTKVSTKALTTKGVAFEEWTDEKIKKTFK